MSRRSHRPRQTHSYAAAYRAAGSKYTARHWLDELARGKVLDLNEIAKLEGRSERSVRMILSLAFLSPEIVSAAITGALPRGLGLSAMIDLPMDWLESAMKKLAPMLESKPLLACLWTDDDDGV